MANRKFTEEELNVLKTIPRNMIGKTSSHSIDENKACFIYDPSSKKLVTVPIQVTIVPVAKKKAMSTQSVATPFITINHYKKEQP